MRFASRDVYIRNGNTEGFNSRKAIPACEQHYTYSQKGSKIKVVSAIMYLLKCKIRSLNGLLNSFWTSPRLQAELLSWCWHISTAISKCTPQVRPSTTGTHPFCCIHTPFNYSQSHIKAAALVRMSEMETWRQYLSPFNRPAKNIFVGNTI